MKRVVSFSIEHPPTHPPTQTHTHTHPHTPTLSHSHTRSVSWLHRATLRGADCPWWLRISVRSSGASPSLAQCSPLLPRCVGVCVCVCVWVWCVWCVWVWCVGLCGCVGVWVCGVCGFAIFINLHPPIEAGILSFSTVSIVENGMYTTFHTWHHSCIKLVLYISNGMMV